MDIFIKTTIYIIYCIYIYIIQIQDGNVKKAKYVHVTCML